MEKLLNERLRELKGATANEIREREQVIHSDELLDKWADEIERYYIPRPRFEDGEPVKRGDETAWGIVDGICVYSDGAWTLDDSSGTDIWGGTVDVLVKRPTPKVYDADGVPYERGEHVWDIEEGLMWRVKSFTAEKVNCERGDEEEWKSGEPTGCSRFPTDFTHERPVFDAEGVRIRKDDTVWDKDCNEYKVEIVSKLNGHILISCPYGQHWAKPEELTHHEPDSLEKLYADMRENSDNGKNDDPNTGFGFLTHDNHLDRFRALIERGA